LLKLAITAAVGAAFLFGDFKLFERLFRAVAEIEQSSPFFALGLLRNLIALVFLIAITILFSSSMTAAIGAFFADLDLDTFTPRRWERRASCWPGGSRRSRRAPRWSTSSSCRCSSP